MNTPWKAKDADQFKMTFDAGGPVELNQRRCAIIEEVMIEQGITRTGLANYAKMSRTRLVTVLAYGGLISAEDLSKVLKTLDLQLSDIM